VAGWLRHMQLTNTAQY